jgi:hypothetical protein
MHRPTPRPKNARRASSPLRHRMMAGRRPVRMRAARPKPTPPCRRGARSGRRARRIAAGVGAAVAGRLISIRPVRSMQPPGSLRAHPLRRVLLTIPVAQKRAAKKADHSGRFCGSAIGDGVIAALGRCRGSDRPKGAAQRPPRAAQPRALLGVRVTRQRVARPGLGTAHGFGRAVDGGIRAFHSPGTPRAQPVMREPRKARQETQAPRRQPGPW